MSVDIAGADMSQVGVALFPSFQNIFYHFTFPGFPFILIEIIVFRTFRKAIQLTVKLNKKVSSLFLTSLQY